MCEASLHPINSQHLYLSEATPMDSQTDAYSDLVMMLRDSTHILHGYGGHDAPCTSERGPYYASRPAMVVSSRYYVVYDV